MPPSHLAYTTKLTLHHPVGAGHARPATFPQAPVYRTPPGMPGPYGTAAIKNACSQNKKARSLFAGENALNLC